MTTFIRPELSIACNLAECDECTDSHPDECECTNGFHEREPEEPWPWSWPGISEPPC